MNRPVEIRLAGEAVELWPGRAFYWPSGWTLFIADPHFGKAAAFRLAGIAAPDGTLEDLARLDRLLDRTKPRRLVVLGDFLHARSGVTAATREALEQWRRRQPELEITVVRGNHDRGAGDPPAVLRVDCVDGPWELGPWSCRHEPSGGVAGHVLAGHVHPGISLRDINGARLRAGCFVSRPRLTILPAFGSFTGLQIIRPRRGDRVFAATEHDIVELRPAGY